MNPNIQQRPRSGVGLLDWRSDLAKLKDLSTSTLSLKKIFIFISWFLLAIFESLELTEYVPSEPNIVAPRYTSSQCK